MKKYMAEFIGTFTLVLFACGTAVVSGQAVGHLGIAFAFGFALLAMCYGIGPVSGCHVNPAVSLGVFTAGRMTAKDLVGYIVGQLLGGIAAAGVLAVIAKGLLSGYSLASSGLRSERVGRRLPGRICAPCRRGL
jgi:aquaporin Z